MSCRAGFSPRGARHVIGTAAQWWTVEYRVSAFTLEFCFLVVLSFRLLDSLSPQNRDLMCLSRPFKTALTTCLHPHLPEVPARDPLVLALR